MCNFWNAKIDANGAINFSQRVSLRKHVFENRQENIFDGKDKIERGFVRLHSAIQQRYCRKYNSN